MNEKVIKLIKIIQNLNVYFIAYINKYTFSMFIVLYIQYLNEKFKTVRYYHKSDNSGSNGSVYFYPYFF